MGSKREKKRKSKKSKRKKSSSSESTSQSSSSDSGDDRKRQKSEKLAQKVVAHLQKSSGKGPDQPFVWGKKVEKELAEGKKLKDISVFSDRNRLQERLEELEKVRKRQADRELEKARREEELGMVQRMRAAQEAMDSEAKEEEFYLQSLLSKAERRLREGRPAPSDLIARNLHAGLRLGEPADVDMKEPWSHFTRLQLDDVEALHDDIREYAEYDKHEPMHTDFWKALLAVADHELLEARKRDAVDRAHLAGGADAAARLAATSADGEKGLHPDVEADIQVMLQGQTYNELCSLEASLQASLASGEGDPEYWHAVLQRLQLHKAKAHVRDIQSRIVSATLQRLAQEAAEAEEELGLSASPDDSQGSYDGSSEDDDDDDDDDDKEEVEGGGAGGKQQQGSGAAKVRPAGILGTAVGRAMGWAREDRQVVRAPGLADAEPAAGAEEAAGLANPEEIELDYGEGSEDGDKAGAGEQAQAQTTTGEAGLSGDVDAGPSGVATADEKKSKKKSKKSRRPRDAARDTAVAGQEGDGEGDDAAGALGPSMVGPQPANVVFPSEVPGFGRRRRRPRKGADNEAEDLARRVGGEVEEAEEAVADGTRSPEPVDPLSIVGQEVVHEEDDYRELELLRQSVKLQTSARFRAARSRGGHHSSTQDRNVRSLMRDSGRVGVHPMMRNIAAVESEGGFRAGIPAGSSAEDEALLASFRQASVKLMGNDGGDRDYGGEVPLEAQVYWWHDKYKPRRPKYFNRVHTGYEWSKYNQTHYDYDNPPPKVVQGYKFNILYHDLIDRSQTPQYVLERDPQSTDNSTCIIRFVAGPPYEDIAFRIVNKEWNYARKHGFRCSFERGILHVFFNFKRARYRR